MFIKLARKILLQVFNVPFGSSDIWKRACFKTEQAIGKGSAKPLGGFASEF